ncbi:Bromodomain adjacent to zinc finger domain protein 1A [Homalodisca vitripennis]|nr:Bromodomain adjacent to zinc finger domain protein 1A [Homalodisca vitripennis]
MLLACTQSIPHGNIPNETSPSSDGERASRRRSSKAATAKISQFAKQLRTNTWEGDNEGVPDGSRRRSRRSLEAELVVTTNSAAKDLPLDNATLQEILDQMMHHEAAWPFLRPVTRADVEDYHDIIKHPMDFGTIKHKLNMLDYRNNSEVLADALLVFENCYAYNKEDTEIYQ